jgi:hypothetical protein
VLLSHMYILQWLHELSRCSSTRCSCDNQDQSALQQPAEDPSHHIVTAVHAAADISFSEHYTQHSHALHEQSVAWLCVLTADAVLHMSPTSACYAGLRKHLQTTMGYCVP